MKLTPIRSSIKTTVLSSWTGRGLVWESMRETRITISRLRNGLSGATRSLTYNFGD